MSQSESLSETTQLAEARSQIVSEWSAIVMRLFDAAGKEPTQRQLKAYYTALAHIPLGLLEPAVTKALQEHRFASVATPAQVIDAVYHALGKPRNLQAAIDNWVDSVFDSRIPRKKAVTEHNPKKYIVGEFAEYVNR